MERTNLLKKKIRSAFVTGACCLCVLATKAQDPHFSQYFNSPSTLNPALTGKDIADWRVLANFRSQWWGNTETAPFTTTSVSIEKAYPMGSRGQNTLGVGLSMLSDASNSGLLKSNFFTLGAAYTLSLDVNGDEQLGLGLQGSYANRLADASKFEFQSQFGSLGFQRVPSNDPVNINSNKYWDMNAGVYYSKNIAARNWGYRFGASVYHAGSPKAGVYNTTVYRVEPRVSLQGGLSFRSKNSDALEISAAVDLQGDNRIYSLGVLYKANLGDDTIESLNIGLWNRFGDSFYPYIGIEGKQWLIGLSYDVIKPSVSTALNSVQSMEFSLAWHFNSAKRAGVKSRHILIY